MSSVTYPEYGDVSKSPAGDTAPPVGYAASPLEMRVSALTSTPTTDIFKNRCQPSGLMQLNLSNIYFKEIAFLKCNFNHQNIINKSMYREFFLTNCSTRNTN